MKNLSKVLATILAGVVVMVLAACNNGAEPVELTVSADSVVFDAAGVAGAGNVITVTGSDWTATTTEGWITIAPQSGADGAAFTVSVEDSMQAARSGVVVVTSTENTSVFRQVVIEQQAYPLIQDPEAVVFVSSYCGYWGDYYGVDTGNFLLSFGDAGYEEEPSNGYYINLDLLAEVPVADSLAIASGTYTVNDSLDINTIYVGVDTDLAVSVDGDNTGTFGIVGGTVQIDNRGDGEYVVVIDVELSDGSAFKGYYNGTIPIDDLSGHVMAMSQARGRR